MLTWALIFFIIANIVGVLGFTNLVGDAAGIAEILFFVFLGLFVVCLLMRRRSPPM